MTRIQPIDWGRGRENYESEYGIVNYRNKKVLDVGADVGSTADFFLMKGARIVIAVEGNKKFYKKLKTNAQKVKGITPVFLWIKCAKHFESLIKKYRPDVVKVDCDDPGKKTGCEKYLFRIPSKIFSIAPEYIIETHTNSTFHAMKRKCKKNGYRISNVVVRHRPDLRVVYARRSLKMVKGKQRVRNYLRKVKIPKFKNRKVSLSHLLRLADPEGLYMEFGVWEGVSINYIASKIPEKTVYGFDVVFEGLPEYYRPRVPKGACKLDKIPEVANNVELVIGWFQDTLKPFLEKHKEKTSFIHLDADLYSSTRFVLFTLAEHKRLQKGTVIQFDEIFWADKSKWYQGEYRALQDLVKTYNAKIKWLGYGAGKHKCGAIMILEDIVS